MTETAEAPAAVNERPVIYRPFPGPQTEFHERSEDVVLFGGSKGPGKTHALLFEALRQVDKSGYKALLIRRTFPRLQEMIDRAKMLFIQMGAKWEGQEHRFRFPSGATVAFGHCEYEDAKFNYQGHEYAFIGFDQLEEFTESQYQYLTAQCRTSDSSIQCYIRATANPGNVGHWWIKRRFIDGKTANESYTETFILPTGGEVTRTSCYVPAKVYDNPALLKSNPNYLATLMSLPEAERKAFLEGDWEAFSTGGAFDQAGINAQERAVRDAVWTGLLRDTGMSPEFVVEEKGPLSIWRTPVSTDRYFIAADVAKGVEGGDYSVALVLDRNNWEVVAKWHGRIEPSAFGKALYGLGLYYNNARVSIEVWPGPGLGSASKLVELGYPKDKLYRRVTWDGEQHKTSTDIGFVTDERGRYDLINALQEAIRHKRLIIRDRLALDECKNFVRNERGRFEARSGCHDDHVIALGIACFCMVHDPLVDTVAEKRADGPVQVVRLIGLPGQKKTKSIGLWRKRNGNG